jgi:hypothetical protein
MPAPLRALPVTLLAWAALWLVPLVVLLVVRLAAGDGPEAAGTAAALVGVTVLVIWVLNGSRGAWVIALLAELGGVLTTVPLEELAVLGLVVVRAALLLTPSARAHVGLGRQYA